MSDPQEKLTARLSEGFDFTAIVDKAVKEIFGYAGHLESLKRKIFLTSDEVEELYGISKEQLEKWRKHKGGPEYFQESKGAKVFYEHIAIHAFIRKHKRN